MTIGGEGEVPYSTINQEVEPDYDDVDSDKDDNIGNGGNDKNKCGHRGGSQAQSIWR